MDLDKIDNHNVPGEEEQPEFTDETEEICLDEVPADLKDVKINSEDSAMTLEIDESAKTGEDKSDAFLDELEKYDIAFKGKPEQKTKAEPNGNEDEAKWDNFSPNITLQDDNEDGKYKYAKNDSYCL